nr:hypothetical protein [Mammaliicoccus sp. Marseille-Q6498]
MKSEFVGGGADKMLNDEIWTDNKNYRSRNTKYGPIIKIIGPEIIGSGPPNKKYGPQK